MAVVRARSSPPYALIVFVFLTVISAGFAIYLGAKNGDMAKQAADSDKKAADAKKALDASQKQVNDLKAVMVEVSSDPVEAAINRANRALSDSGKPNTGRPGSQLVPQLDALTQALKQSQDQEKALRAQVKTLEDQASATATSTKGVTDAAQATNTQIKEQLTAQINATAQERKEKEDAAKAAEDALTKTKTDAENARRDLVLKLEQANQTIAQLQSQIEILRGQIKREQAPTVAIAPAGHITRARAGTGECYIDIGRRDRVVVGMTFSVHDPRIGIRGKMEDASARGDTEAAGKGGIEVIEIGEAESLCRIEHTTEGQVIQAGDLISNPVYQNSKNRKSHFVVIGDFDLDGDGVTTAGEHDRIVHMITAWGGVIDDKLTPQTDYLVEGSPPANPTSKNDDQAGGVADARKKLQDDYRNTEIEAKRSSVPILNANRFLAMVGYYNTTIVR